MNAISDLNMQLDELQRVLSEILDDYQRNQAELKALQTRPSVEMEVFEQVKNQTAIFREQNQQLQGQLVEQAKQLNTINDRYQSLAESHSVLSSELEQTQQALQHLHQEHQRLQIDNQRLLQKNQVAAEHAQRVLERLTKIDTDMST